MKFVFQDPLPEQAASFLECIYEMYRICTSSTNISKSLFWIANRLTEFCCHPILMDVARNILSRVIMDFTLVMEIPLFCSLDQLFWEVKKLPNDVRAWPISCGDAFFILVHLQCDYSKYVMKVFTLLYIYLQFKCNKINCNCLQLIYLQLRNGGYPIQSPCFFHNSSTA